MAAHTVPVVERHVRASAVIVLENLLDEDKEVEQPPLREGRSDRRSAVPFTEDLVANMRMSDASVCLGSAWRFGNDLVRMRPADAVPLQNDAEWAQIDPFQDDGVGHDADLLLLQINGDLLELLFEGKQVGGQIVGCGDALRPDR